MRKMRKVNAVTTFVTTVAGFIISQWGVIVTVVTAGAIAILTWASDWEKTKYVLAGTAMFFLILWSVAAFVWLASRSSPQIVKAHQDYSYGLTFEGLSMVWDPEQPSPLQFGIQLSNYNNGPIKYQIEEFDVRVGTRALPRYTKGTLKSIMPRGARRTSRSVPFSASDLAGLDGEQNGTIDFSIAYGHPELPPTRRLSMKLAITLVFNRPPGKLGIGESIVDESDTEI